PVGQLGDRVVLVLLGDVADPLRGGWVEPRENLIPLAGGGHLDPVSLRPSRSLITTCVGMPEVSARWAQLWVPCVACRGRCEHASRSHGTANTRQRSAPRSTIFALRMNPAALPCSSQSARWTSTGPCCAQSSPAIRSAPRA